MSQTEYSEDFSFLSDQLRDLLTDIITCYVMLAKIYQICSFRTTQVETKYHNIIQMLQKVGMVTEKSKYQLT